MGIIRVLSEEVSNIIAAGEVVESPSSLVKELLENSIDAKSTKISIEVKDGGRYIRISDNGVGMLGDDLLLCVERHATSKIKDKEDIFNLQTYGFRGEALSSICAVARVKMSSKTEEGIGNTITVLGSKITSFKEAPLDRGTEIEIKDLFFNTPARLKFLRREITEYSHIKDIVFQEALANPDIAISLTLSGKESISTSGNGIKNSIVEVFGRNILKNLVEFELGFLGNSSISRSTKDSIYIFVNGRVIKSKLIETAVIDSYYTKLSKGKYPFAILFINVDGKDVDVNVHPSKKIVKFSNDTNIYNLVSSKIKEVISKNDDLTARELNIETIEHQKIEKVSEEKNIEINTKANTEKYIEKYNNNEVKYYESIPMENKKILEIEEMPKTEILEKKKIEEEKEIFENLNEKNSIIKKNIENIFTNFENSCKLNMHVNKKENEKKEKEGLQFPKITDNISSCKDNIPKLENSKNLDLKVIGQFMNSYIIVENKSSLEIYDQHIVHERILYENYKKEYEQKEIKSQGLLIPQRIFLDPIDMDRIHENIELLNSFGFEIEEFGKNEVLIRAIPTFSMKESVESFFRDILAEIGTYRNRDPREGIIITMSCKGAIKAGEALKHDEMVDLIEKLHEIGEYTCPHGRPIILRLSLDEMEKKFKRK